MTRFAVIAFDADDTLWDNERSFGQLPALVAELEGQRTQGSGAEARAPGDAPA